MKPGEAAGWDEDGGEFSPDYWSIQPLYRIPTGRQDENGAERFDDWHFDPRLAVRPCEIETVGLWFSCGGRDGLRHLPQAGGLLDQAAVMIDAFNIIAAAVAAHDPKKAE